LDVTIVGAHTIRSRVFQKKKQPLVAGGRVKYVPVC
jgi:hypothetical protein